MAIHKSTSVRRSVRLFPAHPVNRTMKPIKIRMTHLHSLAIIAFAATQTLAQPTLRAFARIGLDAIDYDQVDLYAPPLPQGPGLNIDLSYGGGTAGVRAGFGPLSIRGHGFFNKPADEVGTHAAHSAGAYWNDELRIDAPGKTGTGGYLVSKVRIKGKMLNGDYTMSGSSSFFYASMQVSYGFFRAESFTSAATIDFNSSSPGLTSAGYNGDTPNIGGTQLDQVLSSEKTSFTFGQPNGFGLWLGASADIGLSDIHVAGSGSYNIGTAEAPITVEWVGLEVYDENMELLTTYTAESTSGYDFSLGQAVPVPPTVIGITALGSNAYELKFSGKSNNLYQLQGSTDLGTWFDIGSPFAGNDSEMTLTDTRSEPAFFWRLGQNFQE
jgi:hypothetical protein